MTISAELIGQGIVVAFVALQGIHGLRTDKRRNDHNDNLGRKIDKVYAFVVGPDAKGGVRKDVEVLTERVDGIENRERDRFLKPYTHQPPPGTR